MEFSLDQYYRLNRLSLSIIGLWPYQSANAWIHRVLVVLSLIWVIITQTAKIYISEITADFILDCLPILIPSVGIMAQFISRITINDKLRDLLDQIKADWAHTRSKDEIKIMQTYAADARIATKLFSLYIIVCASTYIFITISPQILDVFLPLNESRSREHPFNCEFFIDEEKYFYVIRFQMYFGLTLAMTIILANGTIFIVYMQHASGMFTVLRYRAERLFRNNEYSSKALSISGTGKNYKNIALFVEDHRNVIQFVDIIQSCYAFYLTCEFLCLMILMGLTLVQIIKFSGISDRPMRAIFYVGGQLIYLFIYSYLGQHLIDTSTQLSMKICYSNWYNMSVWKQKMMLFIMMKCMRTVSISLYNLCVLSLENLSMIIQPAISICMLLRHV